MPPPTAHKTLTPAQIATIKRWIEEGAPWQEHWAYRVPVKPAPPAVRNTLWPRTPIDRFILARLEHDGLTPALAADKRTLLRRVALDLTGLPPTPAEIEEFLADMSPEAYERMVDRYLASPHFGEHRARFWLDAARYGDTHGIHIDNYREIWPYRDWVIQAFNRNMPFDRFAIEQLAGDLLPNPTLDQLIATGFQRCNVTTNEGGAIEDEYAEIYAKDRADTTGAVFLGMTVGCATCHDHKFDPITQKDFYALGAFFRNTSQPVMDGNIADTFPVLAVPLPEDRKAYEKLLAKMKDLEGKLAAARTTAPAEVPANVPALFTADDELKQIEAAKPFTISIRFSLDETKRRTELASQNNPKDRGRGWVLETRNEEPVLRLTGDNGKSIEVRPRAPVLVAGKSYHLAVTYDGSREAAGLAMWLDGKRIAGRGGPLRGEFTGGFPEESTLERSGYASDFRTFNRVLSDVEILLLCQGDKADPREVYLLRAYAPVRDLTAELQETRQEAAKIAARGAVVTHVMNELPGTPYAHVLYRGRLRPEARQGGGEDAVDSAADESQSAAQPAGLRRSGCSTPTIR